MIINVKYLDSIKKIVGKNEEKIEMDQYDTINNLIQKLGKKYGEVFLNIIMDSKGNLKDDILILINGKSIKTHKEMCGEFLSEEAVAVILSIKTGG